MKRLICVLFCVLFAVNAEAAITRGTFTALGTGTGPYSFVVGSGHTALLCQLTGSATGETPTAMTHNGDAMTQVGTITLERPRYVYFRADPDVGTFNIAITWSGDGTPDYSSLSCATYSAGASPSVGTATTATESDGSVTGTVTVGAASSWLVGMGIDVFGGSPGAGAGTSVFGTSSDTYHTAIDSNGAPGTGSRSLEATGATDPAIIVMELIEGGGGGGGATCKGGLLLGGAGGC